MNKLKNLQYQLLLFALFLYLILTPFLRRLPIFTIILNLFLSYVLLSAIFTLHKNKTLQFGATILLLACILPLWLNFLGLIVLYPVLQNALLALYLSGIIVSMLIQFFSAKKVNAGTIYAALSVYLLIGFFWGAIYALVDTAIPHSFQGALLENMASPELRFHRFIYFSFVTLTTLGYGDIVPATIEAASLCQAEAIMGQFFISVLVAQIVGIRIASGLRVEVEK